MVKRKMICPRCGAEMNHHAEKLNYMGALEETEDTEESGGILEEIHTCPACGDTEARHADGKN